ncbi:hypothetical protein F4805DRAFT_472224 [Annulohypoxylon moriforme]|nr:hypothetical protein F4805DRAFT_472224 [Annulohypoxylon moriforme]
MEHQQSDQQPEEQQSSVSQQTQDELSDGVQDDFPIGSLILTQLPTHPQESQRESDTAMNTVSDGNDSTLTNSAQARGGGYVQPESIQGRTVERNHFERRPNVPHEELHWSQIEAIAEGSIQDTRRQTEDVTSLSEAVRYQNSLLPRGPYNPHLPQPYPHEAAPPDSTANLPYPPDMASFIYNLGRQDAMNMDIMRLRHQSTWDSRLRREREAQEADRPGLLLPPRVFPIPHQGAYQGAPTPYSYLPPYPAPPNSGSQPHIGPYTNPSAPPRFRLPPVNDTLPPAAATRASWRAGTDPSRLGGNRTGPEIPRPERPTPLDNPHQRHLKRSRDDLKETCSDESSPRPTSPRPIQPLRRRIRLERSSAGSTLPPSTNAEPSEDDPSSAPSPYPRPPNPTPTNAGPFNPGFSGPDVDLEAQNRPAPDSRPDDIPQVDGAVASRPIHPAPGPPIPLVTLNHNGHALAPQPPPPAVQDDSGYCRCLPCCNFPCVKKWFEILTCGPLDQSIRIYSVYMTVLFFLSIGLVIYIRQGCSEGSTALR